VRGECVRYEASDPSAFRVNPYRWVHFHAVCTYVNLNTVEIEGCVVTFTFHFVYVPAGWWGRGGTRERRKRRGGGQREGGRRPGARGGERLSELCFQSESRV